MAGLAVFANQPHDVCSFKGKDGNGWPVGDSDRQLWEYVKKDAAKKYGIDISQSYVHGLYQANQALVDKSIDLNAFQTINYFDVQNKNFKGKLVSVGKT